MKTIRSRFSPLESTGDDELIRRVRDGDQQAFGELHRRYRPLLFKVVFRITGDAHETEDVLQQVLLVLWHHSSKWDESKGRLRSWLGMVARNRALDAVRHRGRRGELLERCAEEEAVAPDHGPAEPGSGESRRELRKLLAALPPKERKIVTLAFLRGLSHSEISDRTGLPVGTVKSRIHRGLELLRSAFRQRALIEKVRAA